MSKTKVLIQVFSLVKEIDYLERTLLLLKQNSLFVNKEKYHIILDINFLISDYLTDWEKSILKKDYFLDRLEHLKKYYTNWCDECHFDTNENVKGALGYFIKNLDKYPDVDSIILLEPDVIFGPYTLSLFLESSTQTKQYSSNYIITAEYVKMWDTSWDVVVNSNFINKPFNYRNIIDPISDTYSVYGDINLIPLIIDNRKYFKFGGGWFTMYSKSLFDLINFPKTLDGYGPLDNYVMSFCYNKPDLVTQYKIENLVITDYHNDTTYYDNYICSIDRKQDLYQKNNEIMFNHFKNKFGF
jgi:hypothetical protein